MTLARDLIGQKRALALLSSFIANDTIPHAFLFSGPDGVGKKTAARLLAMALNCLNPPVRQHSDDNSKINCGQCRACRLIDADKHPDILHLKPEGSSIKVDQIRRLIEELLLKPVEARTRVVVIQDVQKMNTNAANALLKTLEEPYPNTVFVLTAHTATEVLPTILSRCQRIAFQPLTTESLRVLLSDAAPVNTNWGQLAYLAGGSLVQARKLLAPSIQQRHMWLLNEMAVLPQASSARILSLANELNKNKQALAADLEVMLSYLRDLTAVKISPSNVINDAFWEQLQYNSSLYSLKDLNAKLSLLQTAVVQLTNPANTNPRLGLEHLLFALQ